MRSHDVWCVLQTFLCAAVTCCEIGGRALSIDENPTYRCAGRPSPVCCGVSRRSGPWRF